MLGAVAVAVLLGTGSAPAHRADLMVSDGSVRATEGTLTGSFVITNVGRKAAGRSTARLTIKAAGRRRFVGDFAVGRLRRATTRTIKVGVKLPGDLPAGTLPVRACADSGGVVRERSETNNCRRVGRITIAAPGTGGGGTGPGSGGDQPQTGGAGGQQQPQQQPEQQPSQQSSVPTEPIPFQKDTVFTRDTTESTYWIYVPNAYDESHATPMRLLVWLHGCGGESKYDIYTVSPGGDQAWISITVGGREGGCWDVNADGTKVLAAIADAKKHFNIDPHRVIIGGYSSGGDLSYRTAFYNANMFAGLLAENTSPFRDTGSSQSDSLAAAAWKFNVVHLAHTGDDTYPIAGVRDETNAMKDAGFPLTRIERPGTHYDDDTDTTGTDHDLRAYLLPHMSDDWRSP